MKTLRLLFLLVLMLRPAVAPAAEPDSFVAARPVWAAGLEKERNILLEFRAAFARPAEGPVRLRITGASLYRVFVNGTLAAHGPARAGHGFYRVDEWELDGRLQAGTNDVLIEVAGYNANSFYLLDQPSFLQAELVAGGRVLAATGGEGFTVLRRHDRVQRVQRYSFQRPFTEVWLKPGPPAEPVRLAETEPKPLAPRRVPYPDFAVVPPAAHFAEGEVLHLPRSERPWKDRSLTGVGPQLAGFPEGELETIPSLELQRVKNAVVRKAEGGCPFTLGENSFRVLDFGTNLSGFIGLRVKVEEPVRLFVTFDELFGQGDVDFKRLDCVNAVLYELAVGEYTLESFEPYTLRYLKLTAMEGRCTVSEVWLRELANPHAARATFVSADERHNRIFEAARQTFRQNATDVFMDCPSRERAGWLCDSFFTARVAEDLCGETTVERNFFENFQRPAAFAHLPEGMLPMCYPADHYDGVFIPNWSLWFLVQLEEYAQRGGDRALIDALRPRVEKLLAFFRRYENADGLLEKLPSWVFVEWSKANQFVQDVNYPSSMLYAGALDAAGRLYGRPEWSEQAGRVREAVRRQSFDGTFFVDNALRRDGKLEVTRNRTEVCQYFAFYFGVATPETHGALWDTLTREFGPARRRTKAHPEVHPANAFIGNQLRFELLSRAGLNQQILDEAADYWLYMADRTGTLWEHDSPSASCNHGFASHAAHVLLRDVLGLYRVDRVGRKVTLRFADLKLASCRGAVPTSDGPVELAWRREGERLLYRCTAPAGYEVTVENRSTCELVRE